MCVVAHSTDHTAALTCTLKMTCDDIDGSINETTVGKRWDA